MGRGTESEILPQHRRWGEIKEDTGQQFLVSTHVHTNRHLLTQLCPHVPELTHHIQTHKQIKSKGDSKVFSDKQKLTDSIFCG